MNTVPAPGAPLLSADQIHQLVAAAGRWPGFPQPTPPGRRGRVGEHSARAPGSGLDYAETRRYQPGDPPRHINWRASARQQHTQVRVFHQDISPQTGILLDRRAGMCFGTRARLKLTQALRLAVFLAAHETARGHEVAVLDMGAQLHWLPPRAGSSAVRQLLGRANQTCMPGGGPAGGQGADSTFDQALPLLQHRLPHGSHIYLLSDFGGLDDGQRSALQRLARACRVQAVQLFDPAEQALPALGPLSLAWDGAQHDIDSDDPAVRAAIAQRFAQRQQALAGLCAAAGVGFAALASTADDLPRALTEMAGGRA